MSYIHSIDLHGTRYNCKLSRSTGFGGQLKLPKLVPMELIVEASPRRVYGNAHTYHVNSISVNSDQV